MAWSRHVEASHFRSLQSGEPKASAGDPTQIRREGADFFTTSSSSKVSRTGPKWFVFIVICTVSKAIVIYPAV